MRAKRSKKYRKLMHQYEMTFGFREPYQVLGMIPSEATLCCSTCGSKVCTNGC